jgi:nucleoside 2-deoxyribosyltransferase
MNYLSGKSVYLAGPMFACADDGAAWRTLITPRLLAYGVSVENPVTKTLPNGMGEVEDDKKKFVDLIKAGKFLKLKKIFKPIGRKDLRCVDKADFIIAYYTSHVHMFGTIHELVLASQQSKPILLFIDKKCMEDGTLNPWLSVITKPSCWFTDWDVLFNHLDNVNQKIAPYYDEKFWTI